MIDNDTLRQIKKNIEEALNEETRESLTKWLLRKRKGSKVIEGHNSNGIQSYTCLSCGNSAIFFEDNHCNGCGSKIDWDSSLK